MKLNIDSEIKQLEDGLELLNAHSSSLPNPVFQGISVPIDEVINTFKKVISRYKDYASLDLDAISTTVHLPGIRSSIPSFTQHLNSYIANNGSPSYSDNFIASLWGIQSPLLYLNFDEFPKLDSIRSLIGKDSKSILKDLEGLNEKLRHSFSNLERETKEIINSKDKLSEILVESEKNYLEISNSKANAEANVAISAQSRELLEDLLVKFKGYEDGIVKLDEVLNEKNSRAEAILGLAHQGALAKAFRNRRKLLETSQKQWIRYFTMGLGSLFIFTLSSISFGSFFNLPPVIVNNAFDYWGVVTRLLLVSPIIWFTWFSIRQFSNNVALIEDYAFKEASALAFVGYKKDMEDDKEMVKLLRESAIQNFATSPSRLISKSQPTSPAQELLEKLISDREASRKLKILSKFSRSNKKPST